MQLPLGNSKTGTAVLMDSEVIICSYIIKHNILDFVPFMDPTVVCR
jgi:hypothetical protein